MTSDPSTSETSFSEDYDNSNAASQPLPQSSPTNSYEQPENKLSSNANTLPMIDIEPPIIKKEATILYTNPTTSTMQYSPITRNLRDQLMKRVASFVDFSTRKTIASNIQATEQARVTEQPPPKPSPRVLKQRTESKQNEPEKLRKSRTHSLSNDEKENRQTKDQQHTKSRHSKKASQL